MTSPFEELDFQDTPLGELSLRRRRINSLAQEIYEIKLGDEFLMSSLFTASERALGTLGIAERAGTELDIVVGGLGLGYTAQAVLEHDAVRSLLVIEALEPVIAWHRRGLLPLDPQLSADPRCSLLQGDFFAAAASAEGFDPERPGRRFDAALLDIDHSPDMLLDDGNQEFYRPEGLRRLAAHLRPGGVFGLWSNDPPRDAFVETLESVFDAARAEAVTFHNPLQKSRVTQAVYLARTGDAESIHKLVR